jgi:hypothetical protein
MAVKAALASASQIPYEQAGDPSVPLKLITTAADAPPDTRNQLS